MKKLLLPLILIFAVTTTLQADELCVGNAKITKSGKRANVKKAVNVKESCGKKEKSVINTDDLRGADGTNGQDGAAGQDGVIGYEFQTNIAIVNVDALSTGTAAAQCSNGKVILGGSCLMSGAELPFFSFVGSQAVMGTPDQYECTVRNGSGLNKSLTVTIVAICADPS